MQNNSYKNRSFKNRGRGQRNQRNRGGYRSGGGRFQKGNRGRGGRGRTQPKIDISKFINKAQALVETKPYEPTHSFRDFAVDDRLKENVLKKGFDAPTPIQDQSIPHILEGRDIVGIANTGTGKTAAFLIPLIDKVLKNPKENVLVMAPTRELAIQIEEELRFFTKGTDLFSVCAVGGAPIGRQIGQLRRRNNFVIGTPGRLKDLVERKALDLSRFGTVVLDEADRMLDMGFIRDMRFMLERLSSPRHTLFFSATLSKEIERLIGEFLQDPVHVSVKTGDTAKNVDQDIVTIERGKNKFDVLRDLLAQPEFGKVLVFGRTKHGVERLARDLSRQGLRAGSIHGNKSQSQRERALGQFKKNQIQTLVATDVAARGLDITDITHVINFDMPATDEDYVHRIGRTGRGDKTGKALTFVDAA